jgi:hypothetical protein
MLAIALPFAIIHVDWHILSDSTIKTIAAYAPTTKEQLASMGLLGEEKIKVYGERLVRLITHYIELNGLSEYVENRPGKRKAEDDSGSSKFAAVVVKPSASTARVGKSKARKAIIEISDDEFGGDDIDFEALDIP